MDNPSKEGGEQTSRYQRRRGASKSRTPVLDNFSWDLTKLAEEDKTDNLDLGRKGLLDTLISLLLTRVPKNILVVGEPGVGKRALLDSLAHEIISSKPNNYQNYLIKDRRLVELDFHILARGAKTYYNLIERYKAVRNELEKSFDVFMCIRNIDLILRDDRYRSDLISFFLEPTYFHTISTIATKEYEQIIKNESELRPLFSVINIPPPELPQVKNALKAVRFRYENHHSVKISDEVINLIVELSERYISDLAQPQKSIELLDEIGAFVKMKGRDVPEHITKLIEEVTKTKEEKNAAVANKSFEQAADLRDQESKLTRQLEFAKVQWEEERGNILTELTPQDVFQMVSWKTGIPLSTIEKEQNG